MSEKTFRRIISVISLIIPICVCGVYVYTQYINQKYIDNIINGLSGNLSDDTISKLANVLQSMIPNSINAGIAIIAVAVAVWIGLNIYNLANRTDIDDLKDKIKELERFLELQNLRSEAFEVEQIYRKEKIYRQMINIDPHNWHNYNLLGSLYFKKKDFEQAIDQYDKAIETAKSQGIKYCNAHYNKAVTLWEMQQCDLALEEFKKIDKFSNKDPDITVYLLECYLYKERFAAESDDKRHFHTLAQKEANKLQKNAPSNGYFRNDMGLLYCLEGNYEDAATNFKAALESEPDLIDAQYYLLKLHEILNTELEDKLLKQYEKKIDVFEDRYNLLEILKSSQQSVKTPAVDPSGRASLFSFLKRRSPN